MNEKRSAIFSTVGSAAAVISAITGVAANSAPVLLGVVAVAGAGVAAAALYGKMMNDVELHRAPEDK